MNDKNKHPIKYTTGSVFPDTHQGIIDFYDENKSSLERTQTTLGRFKEIHRQNKESKQKLNKKYSDIKNRDDIRQDKKSIGNYGTNKKRLTKSYYMQKRYNTTVSRQPMWSKHKSLLTNDIKSKYKNPALNSIENTDVEKKVFDRFKENFRGTLETATRKSAGRLLTDSSYSDAESGIKVKLHDALRHDDTIFQTAISRRNFDMPREKTLRDSSTESDNEGIYKNNIYKAFGYRFYKNSN